MMYLIRNIVFFVNIILFYICTNLKLYDVPGYNTILIYVLLVVLISIYIIDIIKKNKDIANNLKYNITSIISNFIIMFIMLRGLFDTNIVTNVLYTYDSYGDIYRMLYVGNNLLYFNIIYICLIIYRIILTKKIVK